jgi:hypothetical protein
LGFAESVVRNGWWTGTQSAAFFGRNAHTHRLDTEPGDDSADIALHMAVAEKVSQRELFL